MYTFEINNFAVVQVNVQILHGNAATCLRRGGILYNSFFRSSSENAVVKSIKIGLNFTKL